MKLPRLLHRLEAVGIGLFAGIAVGWLVGDANFVALGAASLFGLLALLFTRAITPAAARRDVYLLVALALTLRYAIAVTIHDASLAAGRGGFITGDDANYADFSWTLAQILRGQPIKYDYSRYLYLLGTFVYVETAIFAVVGQNVVVVELLNGALGAAFVALVWDLSRRLFDDPRASLVAGILVGFYPSLVLWTSVNLKDSLVLFLVALVLWLLAGFHARPRWWLVPVAYGVLLPIESLRSYIFVGLAMIIPISVAVTPWRQIRERMAMTAITVAISVVFLIAHVTLSGSIPSLSDFETERAAMGIGANTSFADQPFAIRVAYVFLAPFPWSPRRTLDILAAPEMIVWYMLFVAGFITALHRFRSWATFAPLLLFVGGTLLVLLLAEGNVGTLFRHRAMVIPFVAVLAAPTIAWLFGARVVRPLSAPEFLGGAGSGVNDTHG